MINALKATLKVRIRSFKKFYYLLLVSKLVILSSFAVNTPTRPPSVASSRHSCINDDSQQGLADSMNEFPCHAENKCEG